ncbi:MAG: SAM-dependent DNA methyltransferase [Hyphomonas sp.]|uniref:DNA methyltransferase n=1 Tax=Hyphomonas sp. TaxID=87 RepID=UPI001DF9F039|nr:DNA methyltransferase [Hyphomonas sp.]MBA4228680.1 SAM-dependent DNA methyltransferase [Hyphomonas sp.]
MTPAIAAIANELGGLGYPSNALLPDYSFADVLSPGGETRQVALAAFTQTPPSYRTAAFGVVEGGSSGSDLTGLRALGAPMIFAVAGECVELWQVHASKAASRITAATIDTLGDLFARHAEHWSPLAIHRAKAINSESLAGRQFDFIDIGLMIAIEGEVHVKLDALLRETLASVVDARGRPAMDARLLFQATFRFLAAKILTDRHHESAENWAGGSIDDVLRGIDQYYGLGTITPSPRDRARLETVWEGIRAGINFRNISADDLAFVYENTFVTSEAREAYGTHSTPRQMAEHIVRRLELWRDPERVRVYEPFTGAGVLLVAALRQLRSALPLEWNDEERHSFLTERLAGDEIDEFACEVAKLSLILADYPNHNGWDIQQADLFSGDRLRTRITADTFVICNPPFEDFDADDRKSGIAQHDVSKPIAVLEEVIAANPAGIGFVLPSSFIVEKRYRKVRALIESHYTSVEIVEIPDDVFSASRTAAALLIARDRRTVEDIPRITIRSSEVTLRDRLPFLKAGVITRSRSLTRWVPDTPSGDLWVPALHEIWAYLFDRPKLGNHLELHRGIEWTAPQATAWSGEPQPGFEPGLHGVNGHQQFQSPHPVWLDCRPESARGSAFKLPWDQTKLIINGVRLSRYSWRLAASFDASGLVCSQQFIGAWPKEGVSDKELLALMAVLNSPIANAFATVFTLDQRYRLTTLRDIPLPNHLPPEIAEMVATYLERLSQTELSFDGDAVLQRLLAEIDGAILASYALPVRLERELLRFFEGARRPVAHAWEGWPGLEISPGLSLAETLNGARERFSGNWVRSVFEPLPESEAEALRAYIG